MLGYQEGKIGIFRLLGRVFIAMTIHCHNAVGIFIYHRAPGIHTESTHQVAIFLGAVQNLAFVQFVRQMGEYLCRQFHTDADVHAVGFCADVQILAHRLHPLTAAATGRNNTLTAGICPICAAHFITTVDHRHRLHGGVKIEIQLIFQLIIQVFQHHIVNIRAQMAYRGIQ